MSEVTYLMDDNAYRSALTAAQWQQLYDYQTAFGVRMVRIDVFPTADFGSAAADAGGAGCCDNIEQLISYTNATGFPTANLKTGVTLSTIGLYHYPAKIVDATTTWQIAKFGPASTFTSDTVAAVINRFPNGAGHREQMVFFISWGSNWSPTSNYLQHGYIQWMTRGLYAGFRRIYFNTQIDDVHLETELYEPAGVDFRISPSDLSFHASWMADINSRLPAGSKYIVELGHNGNGNIENATGIAENSGKTSTCPDKNLIEYADQIDTALEFQKPLGTGTNIWPTSPATFASTITCMKLDSLFSWLNTPANRDKYAHLSHTYTHEALNNATYSDVNKEITFNQAWLKTGGIDAAAVFSANGLIPPAITGLHNGDAIKAWLDNGIKYVVGDNTRPVLMNAENSFWPLTSTVAANGYAGLEIVPRWATTIYYNCDLPSCTVNEWIKTSAGSGDFTTLLNDARSVNSMHLLGLHHDPFMFHQANLRTDVPQLTINGKKGTYSLLMAWTETVLQEMVRLTSWPVITKKHDDIAKDFIDRRTRDHCGYAIDWNYTPDGKAIAGVTVRATGNTCSVPIPVTVPGPVTSTNGFKTEQVRFFVASL